MGIKGLKRFMRTKCPKSVTKISLDKLSGKTLCIDTPCVMYKYRCSMGDRWPDGFCAFISKLIFFDIDFVFVMEGKTPEEKKITTDSRRKIRNALKEKTALMDSVFREYQATQVISEELTNLWKTVKPKESVDFDPKIFKKIINKRQTYQTFVGNQDYETLKKICKIFNISVFDSPGEAETSCCSMIRSGCADAVITKDSDVLAYKGIMEFYDDIDVTTSTAVRYDKSTFLSENKISEKSFIDFCIMCGTDYNVPIKGIGPAKAFKMLCENKNVESCNVDFSELKLDYTRNKFYTCDGLVHEVRASWPERNFEAIKDGLEKNEIKISNVTKNIIKNSI